MNKAKDIFHKISSVFIVLLILLSTSGFNLDFHMCQGHIKTIGVNTKAKKCMEMQDGKSCAPISKKEGIQRNACCSNSNLLFLADVISTQVEIIRTHSQDFSIERIDILKTSIIDNQSKLNFNILRPPPDIEPNFIILHQVFLI